MNKKNLLLSILAEQVWEIYRLLHEVNSDNLDEVVDGKQTRQGNIQNAFADIDSIINIILDDHGIDLDIEDWDEYNVYVDGKEQEIRSWVEEQINKEK